MLKIVEDEVVVIDPKGGLYVISGHVPYDDEDQTLVVQACDAEQATQALSDHLYSQEIDAEDKRDANVREHGEEIFVITCTLIARYEAAA